MNTNLTWIGILDKLITSGTEQRVRGTKSLELLSNQSVIDMKFPILGIKERGISYAFMFAEAAWILSGDNKTGSICQFNKKIGQFSDDGNYFFGAYGPKVVDQLPHVINALTLDEGSRQAVINIWRENPRPTKDYPCTLSLQFLIRKFGDERELHVIDTMRSSDVWLGVPYDWFNMSMIALVVKNALVQQGYYPNLKLGHLYLNAGSQHLYEENIKAAKKIVGTKELETQSYVAMDEAFKGFTHGELSAALWMLAMLEKQEKGSGIERFIA